MVEKMKTIGMEQGIVLRKWVEKCCLNKNVTKVSDNELDKIKNLGHVFLLFFTVEMFKPQPTKLFYLTPAA